MSKTYDEVVAELARGEAQAHELWVLLHDERDRDGFWLRPMPWEGPGEYQHVTRADGRNGFVMIPDGFPSFRAEKRHGA